MSYLFTSESVSEGHPDKVCDQISDTILDLYLEHSPYSRTAIETLATTNRVIIAGETSCPACIDPQKIDQAVRSCIKKIGYNQNGFNWETVNIENLLHSQSADIALGVDQDGAGDQGIMFGYAKKEQGFDSNYMPLALSMANSILKSLSISRHSGAVKGLEPDAKSQVTICYENGVAKYADSIVVSTQHAEDISQADIHDIVKNHIQEILPNGFITKQTKILINPTGRFVIGGPNGDAGLTGRKIIVDTYGGYAPHGGGAFSGKDATKVDRSAAYMMRYLAKNIVASNLATECLLQVSYAIGIKEPLSLYIDCKGTNQADEKKILDTIKQMIDLTPRGIIKHLNLDRPIFTPTASYGHFGRDVGVNGEFSWEKLDLAEELKKCF